MAFLKTEIREQKKDIWLLLGFYICYFIIFFIYLDVYVSKHVRIYTLGYGINYPAYKMSLIKNT